MKSLRQSIANTLGRRLSRGAYERLTTSYVEHHVGYRLVPDPRGPAHPPLRLQSTTRTLREGCPRWQSRHLDTFRQLRSRRARYE